MTKRTAPALMPLVEDPTQPEFVRELVQAGRNADASGYDFEQGLHKHLALIAAGAPTPPWADGLTQSAPSTAGAGAAPAAAAGSSLVGWLAGSVIGVALISAAWFALRPTAPAPDTVVVGVVKTAPAIAPTAPSGGPTPSLAAPPAEAHPSTATRAARSTSAASEITRGRRADKRGVATPVGARGKGTGVATPSSDSFASAQAPRAAQQLAGGRSSAVVAEGASQARSAQTPVSPAKLQEATPQEATPQEDGKLEREMAMLSMAQRVLVSDPKRALSLARQGEAEFPGSMFTQERQQLLLLALVKLGELDEARRLAKPFLQRYPTGPFSARVRHALASGAIER